MSPRGGESDAASQFHQCSHHAPRDEILHAEREDYTSFHRGCHPRYRACWALGNLALAVWQGGDFNHDSTANAADYVAWRKGAAVAPTPVNHHRWRNNFGAVNTGSSPSAPGSAGGFPDTVPEPATLALLIVAAASVRLRWRAIA